MPALFFQKIFNGLLRFALLAFEGRAKLHISTMYGF